MGGRSLNLAGVEETARAGRLYPGVILHGGSESARRAAALRLAMLLLCEREPQERPCGGCRHCRRIAWPGESETFHPDLGVLERDLRTTTSAEATREFLKTAQLAPFEARGQVFVISSAESLSPGAADALLKLLEEPPPRTPRHFFLLAPSELDLPPTLRSRSLSIFLGAAEELDGDLVAEIATQVRDCLGAYARDHAELYLLHAAEALGKAGDWSDPRSGRPWGVAAAALRQIAADDRASHETRRRVLALAEELLLAPRFRVRGITAPRILEGLVSKHLGTGRQAPGRGHPGP